MLESINLNDLSFEELLEDAIAQIPLYGSEWTNFNSSDPGVTILENLTSFQYVQQDAINTVTDAIRLKLLALLGLTPARTCPAEVLTEPLSHTALVWPPCRKFAAGELVFETMGEVTRAPWRIGTVYCEFEGQFTDITFFLDRTLDAGAAIFGSPAREGACLYCILEGQPDFTRPTYLYARVLDESKRAPFGEHKEPRFAELCWQIYTADGWTDIRFHDETHGFLVSGAIEFPPIAVQPAVFDGAPEKGYAVRCVLKAQEYDLTPRVSAISANLVKLIQRDTGVMMQHLAGEQAVIEEDAMYPHLYVYGRELPTERYRDYNGAYTLRRQDDRFVRLEFAKPPKEVVCIRCTETLAPRRFLGTVYGYLGQELDIDLISHVLEDDFCLMHETAGEGNEWTCAFIKPGETGEDGFQYELLSAEGKIRVNKPGAGRNSRVYLAACAVTAGEAGNIREENQFSQIVPEGEQTPPVSLVNPAPGRDGVTAETIPGLRRRFARMMKAPKTAVLASDYENVVRQTPGLCIHKVKAIPDVENNLVRIVVKPYGETELPGLSESYRHIIMTRLEACRMLTTECRLAGPQYIPIDVTGVVYVKSHFGNAREIIEKALRTALDFVRSDAEFGSPVRFNEVFKAVDDLPCVLSVYDLALTPRGRPEQVSRQGLDIIPAKGCLCHPGLITLELNTRSEE